MDARVAVGAVDLVEGHVEEVGDFGVGNCCDSHAMLLEHHHHPLFDLLHLGGSMLWLPSTVLSPGVWPVPELVEFESKLHNMCAGISSKYYRVEPEACMTTSFSWRTTMTIICKKTDEEVEKYASTGAFLLAAELHFDVCLYKMRRRQARLKIIKANFSINLETRILSLCKSELSMVAKQMLGKVLITARAKLGLTQWKNYLCHI